MLNPYALVLAGGEGERLKSYWEGPKCLLPIDGISILSLIEQRLQGCQLFLNVAEEDVERIKPHISPAWELVVEEQRLGNAAAIRAFVHHYHPKGLFYVQHCDVLAETLAIDLFKRVTRWRAWNVFVKDMAREKKSWGMFTVDGSGDKFPVTASGFTRNRFVNTGVYLIDPAVMDRLPNGGMLDIDMNVFPSLIASKHLFIYELPGTWTDYGTTEFLAKQFHKDS